VNSRSKLCINRALSLMFLMTLMMLMSLSALVLLVLADKINDTTTSTSTSISTSTSTSTSTGTVMRTSTRLSPLIEPPAEPYSYDEWNEIVNKKTLSTTLAPSESSPPTNVKLDHVLLDRDYVTLVLSFVAGIFMCALLVRIARAHVESALRVTREENPLSLRPSMR
jgi:hypothetical protein